MIKPIHFKRYTIAQNLEMAPNLIFNGRYCRKNLTKANFTYEKSSNCDRGCLARLIVRNNQIS
ncbi:hypothetical protein HZS_6442 [Henneguya salminicola]|nr:hypothetical protein HZS_6442 [Henneguya salminicola]